MATLHVGAPEVAVHLLSRSDLVTAEFTITDAAGDPLDLTGYTVTADIYPNSAAEAVSLVSLDATVDTPSTGVVEVVFTVPADHPATSHWRLLRTADGDADDRLTLMRGPLTCEGPGAPAP